MSNSSTIALTSCLTLSLLIQALEMLSIAPKIKEPHHPWHWQNIRDDFQVWPAPLKILLFPLISKHFTKIIYLQIVIALLLPIFFHWGLSLGLIGLCLLSNLRFRGVFNGGSDYMTMTVLVGLTITLYGNHDPLFEKIGSLYIATQCTLSYFIAGVIKLKSQAWRSGFALRIFLTQSNYLVPERLKSLACKPEPMKLASWFIILWECSFPVLWLKPQSLFFVYIAMAFCFHLGNFFAFGLNRFVFAWLASYPALAHILGV